MLCTPLINRVLLLMADPLPSLCSFLLFFLTAPPLHTPTSPPGAGRLSLVSEGVEVGWDVQSVLPLPLIG